MPRGLPTTASYKVKGDAASSGESGKAAKSTTIPYRATLEQLWMIEEVPAWSPTRDRLGRLAASPVHQLADPALAARLLGLDAEGFVQGGLEKRIISRDDTVLGALFESLVTLSVRVYAQANEARVAHLRTRAGEQEVDLIIERSDGRIVALEVKLSRSVDDSPVRHLRWLKDRIGPDLLDAAVITTGPEAYQRKDGIGARRALVLLKPGRGHSQRAEQLQVRGTSGPLAWTTVTRTSAPRSHINYLHLVHSRTYKWSKFLWALVAELTAEASGTSPGFGQVSGVHTRHTPLDQQRDRAVHDSPCRVRPTHRGPAPRPSVKVKLDQAR